MTSQRWLMLIVLAVAGYASLPPLFFRYDPAVNWQYTIARKDAIDRARQFSIQGGIDVSDWKTSFKVERDRNLERYALARIDNPFSSFEKNFLSPLRNKVVFFQPGTARQIIVTLSQDGRIVSFQRNKFDPAPDKIASIPAQDFARKIFTEILGPDQSAFNFGSQSEPDKGNLKLVWNHVSPQDRDLMISLQIVVKGDQLISFELVRNLPPSFREDLTRRDIASFAVVGALKFVLNSLVILAALVVFFLCASRKEIDYLSTGIFFTASLLLLAISNVLNGTLEDLTGGIYEGINNRYAVLGIAYGLFILIVVGMAFGSTLFWASGEATTARFRIGRIAVFASLLRGNFPLKEIGKNLLAGFLSGGFLAAIPFLCALIFRLKTTPVDLSGRDDLLGSAYPYLATMTETLSFLSGQFYLLLLFAFLYPVIKIFIKSRPLGHILFYLSGFVFLSDLNPNQSSSILLKAVITFCILTGFAILYRYFDLLAVLSANVCLELSLKGLTFMAQPTTQSHRTGFYILLTLGLSGAVSILLLKFGAEKEIVRREIANQSDDQAERERLLAEFGVARRAQEQLLPITSPDLPGFSIAALCRPARECGGDLYDFISMPGGKLGIVVADVSGKGVPAALYMTLTKGLLLSVAEELTDPGEILSEVNRHLYEVCKRKMFVTLFFGVIDPATRTMTYSRAGHNPPVWRRMSEQVTSLLSPPGIGLGLNSGKSFDRVLKVEQIQLQSNDLLVLYSDGITEAMNNHQEEYGEERLMKATEITDGMGADETLSALMASVSYFLGETHPQDDQTLVVVRAV